MAQDTDLRLHPPEETRETKSPTPTPKSRWRFKLRPPGRRWLYLLAGLGVVGLSVLVLRPSPKRVDLVTVEPNDLQLTVDAEGETRVRDRFIISAPVDGRLTRIDLEAGDTVTGNQVVARIDPLPLTSQVQQSQARLNELQAQIAGVETLRPKDDALQQATSQIAVAQAEKQQAEADLARAEANWQQAQRELQRANELAARGAISEQARESAALEATAREQEKNAAQQSLESEIAAIDAVQQDLEILQAEQQDPDYLIEAYQAEMAGVEAELAQLADDARRTDIAAPSEGRVLRVMEESARYVTAGMPLLEVGDPGNLEMVIDVLSQDAVQIQPGDSIQVTQWGGDETLLATVQYLEPAAFTKVSALGVEEQRVNVIAQFTDPAVPLGDGYRVDTHIVIDEATAVLSVPVSAIFPCDAGTCVFTVADNRAQQTTVTLGLKNTFAAAVAEGLSQGDQVIAYPESVEAGDRVQAR
ncbi:MAG: HlyD family efflux transporter periplasmic adaptor subunit [Cyanobacteria bacterium P01_D01_bin.115]